MKNYRIDYDEHTREKVLDIISRFSNDVLINDITDKSVGITVEADNPETLYAKLLREIEMKTHSESTGKPGT